MECALMNLINSERFELCHAQLLAQKSDVSVNLNSETLQKVEVNTFKNKHEKLFNIMRFRLRLFYSTEHWDKTL